ncbi:putative Transcription factor Dp-1 [Hypsibius exemplaris]|uniref:Transcription factor Dp-1 n=1 Tax=Hypsibius exemplaris TaxID=2072580 RepID=A0A1W0X8A0_HYPEX|nr:putative Transcription factor Dp-1 [Hypsibius exemplaris]
MVVMSFSMNSTCQIPLYIFISAGYATRKPGVTLHLNLFALVHYVATSIVFLTMNKDYCDKVAVLWARLRSTSTIMAEAPRKDATGTGTQPRVVQHLSLVSSIWTSTKNALTGGATTRRNAAVPCVLMRSSFPVYLNSVMSKQPAQAGAGPSVQSTAAPTTTTSPATLTPSSSSSTSHLPKYFTLSSTKVNFVATATPKAVPSLLKTVMGPSTITGVRAANPQVAVGTASTSATPATITTTSKVLSGSGTSQTVRFPMTFNIPTSANGKNGVIPVVLSPSTAGRPAGPSGVKAAAPLSAPLATTPITPSAPRQSGAVAAAARKRARMEAAGVTYSGKKVKTEEGGSSKKSAAELAASRRRRRTTEDGVKGLRYFATKVCDKVREKNLTSYNAVAEDLVQEYSDPHPSKSREEVACEQKNIRRRVYDALNVLMAINVIAKERKQIRWVGLPRSLNEAGIPKRENLQERKRNLQSLRQRLFHSSLQLIGLKELAEDNKAHKAAILAAEFEAAKESPFYDIKRAEIANAAIASELDQDESQHIHMPFLFVTCGNRCEVECGVSTDQKEYELQFSEPFKIVEDTEVLRNMSLVRALDKGEYGVEEVKKAVQQLPTFMTNRFIGLLNDHQDKIKKLNESIRQQEAARAAAVLDAKKKQQQFKAVQNVLNGKVAIAPMPIKIEEGLAEHSPSTSVPEATASSSAADLFHTVSQPHCAPIASLQTGSPITLKPAYYIQVSKVPPVPQKVVPSVATTSTTMPAGSS